MNTQNGSLPSDLDQHVGWGQAMVMSHEDLDPQRLQPLITLLVDTFPWQSELVQMVY